MSIVELHIVNKPTKQDYKEVIKLHNEVFSIYPSFSDYSAKEAFRRMKKASDPSLFKATNNEGNLIAYAMCYERYKRYYHIWQIGVSEGDRNKGIASALYEEIEKYAKRGEYKGISLNTFNTHEVNIRLIVKRGYEIYDVDKSGEFFSNPKIMFKLAFK